MTIADLKKIAKEIVVEARRLMVSRTSEEKAPVNYACVFAQSDAKYEELIDLARQLGRIAQETAMGPVFRIAPLSTAAGDLELLKIRRPDPRRPEMEMIELIDPSYNALAYFSHSTLADVLKISIIHNC